MSILSLFNQLPGALSQGMIWGIMAIGVYITYKILDFADLTVDGTLSFGGIVLAVAVTNGLPMWLSMLTAFAAGCLAGLVTGLLHTKFGIPAILSGILTQLALYSVYLRVSVLWPRSEGSPSPNAAVSSRDYNVLMSVGKTARSSLIGLAFCVAVIVLLYWFFGTELGYSIRATGCNHAMARANGVNTNLAKITGLVLSNGLVGMSGALLAQYNGAADINMGRGAIVIGLAAVIIGEVLFDRIFRNFALKLFSAVIGSVIYFFIMQLVMWLGLKPNDLKMFSAVMVAVFLGVPYWKSKMDERRKKAAAGKAEGADA